jgi:integrase
MARRKTLTDASVAALKPRAKRYHHADPELPGFYVRVQPTGAKSFAAVTNDPNGKQVWVTIGPVTLYNVEEAREKARETLKAIRGGEGTGPETFLSVSGQWLKRHVANNGLRSRAEIERVLTKYILPAWSGRDFASIRRSDVTALLDKIEDRNGPRQADYALAIVSAICNWFAARNDAYSSPIVRGMKRVAPDARKRERTLADDELRPIWKALAPGETFGDLFKMLLLTAQRREQVATMAWADIDDDGVWTVPSESRGKGTGDRLQLPRAVLDVLKHRARFDGNPYVFAASRRGKSKRETHFSGYSKAKAALDKKLKEEGHKLAPWRLHDLRRTARTLMSRAGVESDHAERVMGHAVGGVEGVYDKHHYEKEKAAALAALAGLVERILHPSKNVTQMKRKRA